MVIDDNAKNVKYISVGGNNNEDDQENSTNLITASLDNSLFMGRSKSH